MSDHTLTALRIFLAFVGGHDGIEIGGKVLFHLHVMFFDVMVGNFPGYFVSLSVACLETMRGGMSLEEPCPLHNQFHL